ncbi:MAG: sugar ABC transporter substrate-binding protein [Bifidobacteriaceae bacterium]|jgi:multiple sugar transport system substrate-binding protein|nr:sugar ABC transporter substrate-binding protein [Bifidobacteriaceae bacterium]
MAKRSQVVATVVAAAIVLGGAAAIIAPKLGGGSSDDAVVTVKLWDEAVAAAYEDSFAQFTEAHPDITVEVVVDPWATYWDNLVTDVAGGTAADIFWLNTFFTTYADNDNLIDVGAELGDGAADGWDPAVVAQYTRDGKLWGVPQLADGGKALLYNADLLADAGLNDSDLEGLAWSPTESADTFVDVAKALTVDTAGRRGDDPEFDGSALAQYGYNAAFDQDAIIFNYVGSNGGTWRTEDGFEFASDASAEAIHYAVDLVTRHHVAPSAADTNENGNFSKEQFLQGNLALFETGLYNLKEVVDGAQFTWGVAPVPAGPAGARTVTNGIIAAGNAATNNKEATLEVLRWLGSQDGSTAIGASGSAVPAVLDARGAYTAFWDAQGVDISPFFAGETFTLPVLTSTHAQEAEAEYTPIFKSMFLGDTEVDAGLRDAQEKANAALAD